MNLAKLFETQKTLRDRIAYNEPDRFNKLVLALLVELGECANEWRGFKYWSDKREPKQGYEALIDCHICQGRGFWFSGNRVLCGKCNETGKVTNPLLEEYVDGLHFVLELGIECNISPKIIAVAVEFEKNLDTNLDAFVAVFNYVTTFQYDQSFYIDMLEHYLGLGKSLGFTWEEIEQAYYSKNAINHARQENGY